MSPTVQHIPQLSNPPLVEAVFVVKWALAKATDDLKHDPHLERTAYGLQASCIDDLPRMERSVPASFGHVGLSYQPIIRYLPEVSDFPQIQFGPGIFTVNQDGRAYEFDSFEKLVEQYLSRLIQAREAHGVGLRVFELSFSLLNRFELSKWDEQANKKERGACKASEFMRDQLKVVLDTPFGDIVGNSPYRQEVSKTYQLENIDGLLNLTVRDASESPDLQIVTFDQKVTTSNLSSELKVSQVIGWLKSAHETTKSVFVSLRKGSSELDDYFNRPIKSRP